MPKGKDNPTSHAQDAEGGLLTKMIVLTLPLLSLQRDMLATVRTSLERDKTDHIKTIENFAALQLHAVMMTLDPARKLRSHFDEKLEGELRAELSKILEKLASGLVSFVEIQQIILPRVIELLKQIKSGKHTGAKRAQ